MGHRKVVTTKPAVKEKREKITKAMLDQRVASSLGVGFHRVAQVTRELIHQLNEAVIEGGVSIYGLGFFSVSRYGVRRGLWQAKKWRYAVRFRPSRVLREKVRRAYLLKLVVRNEDEND